MPSSKTIRIRRWGAMGDVIMASVVAKALARAGNNIEFVVNGQFAPVIEDCPYLTVVTDDTKDVDINFDGVYEKTPGCVVNYELWFKHAEEVLGYEIKVQKPRYKPDLFLNGSVITECMKFLRIHRRPWIGINKGSVSDSTRQLSVGTIEKIVEHYDGPGTIFNMYPYGDDLNFMLPLNYGQHWWSNLKTLMGYILLMDHVVTPVTGPFHIANAFDKRTISFDQSDLTSKMAQWEGLTVLDSDLDCTGCRKWNKCPVNVEVPPCSQPDAEQLVQYLR